MLNKKFLAASVLSLSLVFGLNNNQVAHASTNISGSIANPVWTAADSPYVISNTVEVMKGARLTIEPGAVVKFNKGAKLLIKGELKAIGEAANRIIFTSNQTSPARGDWGGIEFANEANDALYDEAGQYKSGSIIKNATIKYSDAITCTDASPFIDSNIILNNKTGITTTSVGTTDLTDNTIKAPRIIISNNEITDNNIGLYLNRSNKTSFSSTPAGIFRMGDFYEASVLKTNNISNNDQGIVIVRGDTNVLLRNNISNNVTVGLKIEAASQDNILERNIINNNGTGFSVDSRYNNVYRNTISNNTLYGVMMNGADNVLTYNNIANNRDKNLYNKLDLVEVANNYWGDSVLENIKPTIANQAVTKKAIFEPFLSAVVNIETLAIPVLDETIKKTINASQVISGKKAAGTAVLINDQEAVKSNNSTTWQASVSLVVGDNAFKVSLKDETGRLSPVVNFNILREKLVVITDPSFTSYATTTSAKTQIIAGTKDAGSGLWINDRNLVAVNDKTTWSYEMPLILGANKLVIYAADNDNHKSNETVMVITRTEMPLTEIIAAEKQVSATTKKDLELAKKLSGKILLQVEKSGEAWYINPTDLKRYYLGAPKTAFEIMRRLGLGVREADFVRIAVSSKELVNKFLDTTLTKKLLGKIILQVEKKGEAWHINPTDSKKYFLGRPEDAFEIMRKSGLGISNENLRKIEIGETK